MKGRVLIVEDNVYLAELTKDMLGEKYLVKNISTPEEVMSVVHRFKPDVIILDVFLPGKDGISILRDIKTEIVEDIPVIVISVLKDNAVKRNAEIFGAFAFLQKPFEIEDLIELIDEALRKEKGYLIKFKDTGQESENLGKDEIVDMISKKEILKDDLIWDKKKKWWIEFREHKDFFKFFNGKEERIKKKILIVEDETPLREFLSDHFQEKGFDVIKTDNGKDAIYLARRDIPDLIILDIWLPVMDGWTVCKKVKKDERLKSIPVIMVTADIRPQHNLLGISLGAVEYVTKPFSLEDLEMKVEKYL